ncbi:MAG: DUF1684 domain-containing protein [Bacteroidetes bacterium]|nr:DUF1684 domain-containing protein [Bacteroidota bacterium]
MLIFQPAFSQENTLAIKKDIASFQKSLQDEYSNPVISPLNETQRKHFPGIQFFPINMELIVPAKFVKTNSDEVFIMETSSHKQKKYYLYAKAVFNIKGKPYSLNVYQSLDLKNKKGFENFLFIPFKDETSGKETYGGGRYIDLEIPASGDITINFNKAYQPYCAYTEGYNCPIPPAVNTLPIPIYAGVRE